MYALEHGLSVSDRARPAERLGQVDESSLEVVEVLIAARDTEPFYTVKTAAAEALGYPVHEAMLQQDAELMRCARRDVAP